MAEVPLILILVGISAYVVFGGADFGAGLWELTARGERGAALRDHTHRAMAPVWEANHVWLIFILVMAWTCYPLAFSSIVSTLSIPLFVAGVGIIMRGTSYALRAGVTSPREEGAVSMVFALSSVLTPFALGAVIGGIASERVPVGNAAGDELSSWLNPTSLLIGTLAVAVSAYLAGVYLAADARRMGKPDVAEAFRTRALVAGIVAGAIAMAGPLVLHEDAPALYDGLTGGAGLACLVTSIAAGIATLLLVRARRYEPARVSAAAAVVAIVAGWGFGQEGSLLPGLTVEQAAASDATITAVLIGFAAGALILVPSLAFLFRLVLGGRFDPAAPLPAGAGASPAVGYAPTGSSRLTPIGAIALPVGAAITFVADDWVRGIGVAAMLIGSVATFLVLAVHDDG